ncbi:helix-turn-helix domain-containing protein [Bacillus wiedmannii]|uniref:helix-turn-helix domain-containing protein n=1 Tax=Bacillus wiedmannii TaxID=1890302 RepID=UPI0015D5093D|nr:helix-turn-helix transcriptional regulator [Bacillus wiedmannii]
MIGLEHIVKEFHLEYKAVAESIGISSQTIQDWLKGRRKIPKKRLEQLSNYFGLPENYFQNELSYMEKEEIALHYLESISKDIDLPVFNEKDEVVGFYKRASLEDEIRYLKENLENRKKKNDVLAELETLLDYDEEHNEKPLLSSTSSIETINKTIRIMQDTNVSNQFEVIVHLLSDKNEFGGKKTKQIAPEYRDFAKDFLILLEKHKLRM